MFPQLPGPYELANTRGRVVEQIIRPTGLVDPQIEVRSADFQVDDLIGEIRKQVKDGHRILVTTLTKRMAEDLTEYLAETRHSRPLYALGHQHYRAH